MTFNQYRQQSNNLTHYIVALLLVMTATIGLMIGLLVWANHNYQSIKLSLNNDKTDQTQVVVVDSTAPIIDGLSAMTTKLGSKIDLRQGVVVKDEIDQDPILNIDDSMVNYNKAGKYEIFYTATDHAGNTNKQLRQITVVAPKRPVINNEPTRPTSPTPTAPVQPVPGRTVYLTFDDGPSVNTGRVLAILKQYGVKATFFVTCNGRPYNSFIKQAYDSGNAIGLHTCTHNYNIYRSSDSYFTDLNQISDMVNDLIGFRPNIIRFPGGSSNTVSRNYAIGIMSQLVKRVRNAGYQYFDWNCDSTDASGNNVPVAKLVANAKCRPNQVVLLMHDTAAKGTTVQALPQIIEYYKSAGYNFGILTASSFAAHHGVNN